jgi:hypothetical protein
MPRQTLLEDRHRIGGAPARVQRNAVDVGVSRPVGLEFGSPAQFLERVAGPLQSGQREAERMM